MSAKAPITGRVPSGWSAVEATVPGLVVHFAIPRGWALGEQPDDAGLLSWAVVRAGTPGSGATPGQLTDMRFDTGHVFIYDFDFRSGSTQKLINSFRDVRQRASGYRATSLPVHLRGLGDPRFVTETWYENGVRTTYVILAADTPDHGQIEMYAEEQYPYGIFPAAEVMRTLRVTA